MTANEYLSQDAGSMIMQLLIQIAVLKAENEQLRAAANAPSNEHAPR